MASTGALVNPLRVLEALSEGRGITPFTSKEIIAQSGVGNASVGARLRDFAQLGLVASREGHYFLNTKPLEQQQLEELAEQRSALGQLGRTLLVLSRFADQEVKTPLDIARGTGLDEIAVRLRLEALAEAGCLHLLPEKRARKLQYQLTTDEKLLNRRWMKLVLAAGG